MTFVYISAALVSVGVFLGMLWSDQFRGVWFNTGPRTVGPMCIFAWLITMAFIQRFRRPSEKLMVLLAIAGNIIVSLAWFGALIVAAGKSNDGIASHPWLASGSAFIWRSWLSARHLRSFWREEFVTRYRCCPSGQVAAIVRSDAGALHLGHALERTLLARDRCAESRYARHHPAGLL